MGEGFNMRRLNAIVQNGVSEEQRIAIGNVVNNFQNDYSLADFTFPANLTSSERAYVHKLAGQLGLKSNSQGSGQKRRVTISKTMGNNKKVMKTLSISGLSLMQIHCLEPEAFQSGMDPLMYKTARELERPVTPPPRPDMIRLPGSNELVPVPLSESPSSSPKRKLTERCGFSNRLFTQPRPKVPRKPRNDPFMDYRMTLPIYRHKKEILRKIKDNTIIFLSGSTGCGKTTQVPQYILEDAINRNVKVRVVCTVPRRIAAVTVSERVAAERGEVVGQTVGYQIRLESCISPTDTLLTYCTSGVLLRSLASADYSILKNTTHVIIDEIHERDRQTEFLLACLRDVGPQFPNLKVILMGADMNTRMMTAYFGGVRYCPVMHVEGRLHKVTSFFLEDILTLPIINPELEENNLVEEWRMRMEAYMRTHTDDRVDLDLIVKLLYLIHTGTDTNEAVLVFLPGYEEIITLRQMIFSDPQIGRFSAHLVVFLLHSNIQTGDQRAVFQPMTNSGKRKVVLSTNIAETSLTIEDIVYVIDSGRVKEKTYDSMTGVTQLKSTWISKASANQRMGRAGRCREGTCFRLYSTARFNNFHAFPVPEILRSSLHELCMYARVFIQKEKKIEDFFAYLMEPPAPVAVKKAIDTLIGLGALDPEQQLTQLGVYLLDLPIEPALGKALMYALTFKCLDPVLTIVSMISYREPFQLPANPDEKSKMLQSKVNFSQRSLSDHMAYLKAFQEWEQVTAMRDSDQRRFCRERYLSSACFDMVYGIRSQLLGQIRAAGFISTTGASDLKIVNQNAHNWSLVKGILVSMLYPNICSIDRENKNVFNEFDTKIRIHTMSTIATTLKNDVPDVPCDWIVYDEMCQQDFARCVKNCTVINDVALALFGGHFTQLTSAYDGGLSAEVTEENSVVTESKRFDLNNWIAFRGKRNEIEAILYLRKRLNDLIVKRLEDPAVDFSEADEQTIDALSSILEQEDKVRGFGCVEGVGQWPKFVSGNVLSTPFAGYGQDSQLTSNNGRNAVQSSSRSRLANSMRSLQLR